MQNLSQTNRVEREAVLKAGLKEILKWFTLAAKNIIENKIKLPKQTTTFMTKHRKEIQRLADASIDEEIKRKIILKPGGRGLLGGVIIRSLLRWDGSKTARKFGDRQPRAPRKRAPRKKKSSKSSKKKTPKKKTVRTIEENDSEDDFLPMKTSSKKRPSKKRTSKKRSPKKTSSEKRTSKKRTSKKRSPKKRTLSQHSLSLPPPLSSPTSSYMNMSMGMSPRSSPRVNVVDWGAQNRRFELAESHPRVDERNITMRKKRTTVSDQPRFPMSRKALLIKNLYDLKKKNRRFMDKRLQFQPIPSKTWSSWSASLREKYRQAKRDKAQLMHNLGREKIFFSSSPIQTERMKKRLIANSYKH